MNESQLAIGGMAGMLSGAIATLMFGAAAVCREDTDTRARGHCAGGGMKTVPKHASGSLIRQPRRAGWRFNRGFSFGLNRCGIYNVN